jgi:hypothetical protein
MLTTIPALLIKHDGFLGLPGYLPLARAMYDVPWNNDQMYIEGSDHGSSASMDDALVSIISGTGAAICTVIFVT